MKIAIAGLGLIGGSLARAVSTKTTHTVIGYDASGETLQKAKESGAIEDTVESDFSSADLIFVALYPADAVEFIRRHLPTFRPGCIVVDLCGVKRFVIDQVEPLFEGTGVTFVGGHPMAGRAARGFESTSADLFEGASMILTPSPSTPTETVDFLRVFFRSVGFTHIQISDPDYHDQMIAYTSQLAHVVSSAYVQNPLVHDRQGFCAGSFSDMTRVAWLHEPMWAELFVCNHDHLADQIQEFIDNLSQFRDLIRDRDEENLRALLKRGRRIKEQQMEEGKRFYANHLSTDRKAV